ncbi:Diaminopimelate epimerase [hydrothermal vent metagenome]|uniref:diaminopimelate epimerase n=1 Tax=hydrothermal vent metagenome TaxID=652676 RepID=A0A3B0S7W8_9ZZZZ
MKFFKMQGLGNDFVVFEGPTQLATERIVALCDRRTGIGADGVLVATRLDDAVQMTYWNADGSVAEMCGNGLRCVAQLAMRNGWVDPRGFTVRAAISDHPAQRVGADLVRARVGTAATLAPEVSSCGVEFHTVSIGNPHAVTFVDRVADAPVRTVGPDVEVDGQFPHRTNVEFASVRARDHIDLRVWERGVGETNACGTGAAATVFAAHQRGTVDNRVTVSLPGGDLLIEIDGDAVWMEGPAEFVYTGTLPTT